MRTPLTIYSPHRSSRLDFVLEWIGEVFSLPYTVVQNEAEIKDLPFFISYGRVFPNALSIPDTGLLWQTGVQQHYISTGMWNDVPTLYASGETGYSLPFDIFSAIFFLLSRYEEYYPYKPDKHGRYPATESILYKNGWLQRPIIDEWLFEFGKLLEQKGVEVSRPMFKFQPTYDIDIAWSYLCKDAKRTKGGYMRDLLTGKFGAVKERMQVLNGSRTDPYDSFDWIIQAHKDRKPPVYFILAALHTTQFDKNIMPDTMEMTRLIKKLARNGTVGLHPSYYSDSDDTLRKEKNLVDVMIGKLITDSRQHYIKLVFPGTYKLLLANNISRDYSMGYGSRLGFRAGTGRSFYWYDLLNETVRPLRIYPFCFMDTTALFEEKLDANAAFNTLRSMTVILKKTGSDLVTVFHNFSLGTEHRWAGWREAYSSFLEDIYKQ